MTNSNNPNFSYIHLPKICSKTPTIKEYNKQILLKTGSFIFTKNLKFKSLNELNGFNTPISKLGKEIIMKRDKLYKKNSIDNFDKKKCIIKNNGVKNAKFNIGYNSIDNTNVNNSLNLSNNSRKYSIRYIKKNYDNYDKINHSMNIIKNKDIEGCVKNNQKYNRDRFDKEFKKIINQRHENVIERFLNKKVYKISPKLSKSLSTLKIRFDKLSKTPKFSIEKYTNNLLLIGSRFLRDELISQFSKNINTLKNKFYGKYEPKGKSWDELSRKIRKSIYSINLQKPSNKKKEDLDKY